MAIFMEIGFPKLVTYFFISIYTRNLESLGS